MPKMPKNKPDQQTLDQQSPIYAKLFDIYTQFRNNYRGSLASYIPELASANPDLFGITIATVDGKIYEIGDTRHPFTIQSISKVFLYGLALSDLGAEEVLKHVGVEPSGDFFNSIIFNETDKRPFNPMVNAGAIATTALIKGDSYNDRQSRILAMLGRFAGHPLTIDQKVFESEKSTGHRNRAIAYLELSSGMINEPISEHLNLYFMQCSTLVNARDLAIMAATLANHGTNPLTGEQAQESEHIRRMLSVMQSCGMYNFSGEWSYRIGLPAKSGVSGGIIAVVPGLLGIGIYSPLVDDLGNSIRGIQVCEALSKNFHLHMFDMQQPINLIIRRFYTNSQIQSKRQRNKQELEILDKVNHKIHVYELQGDLFFNSVEQLCRKLTEKHEQESHIILDVRSIDQIETSILPLLTSLREILLANQKHLFIAGKFSKLYEVFYKSLAWPKDAFFDTVEDALEWCENYLLAAHSIPSKKTEKMPLEEIDITTNLSKSELKVLRSMITEIHYAAGETIIKEGFPPSELFMLAAGVASIHFQPTSSASRKRIGALSPGITFGELCLFNGGKRTASVIAESESICYVLPITKFEKLAKTHSSLHSKLLINVGQVLSDRIRHINEELKILSS